MADPVGTQPAATFSRVAQRQEWRSLPPLGETLAPPPLVAPNSRFAAGLAVNNRPPPAVAPLGHQRSLEAPPGLVLGVARPVSRPATAGGAPGPVAVSRQTPGFGLLRALQRRFSLAEAPSAPTWPTDAQPADAPAGAASPAESSALPSPPPGTPAALPPPAARRVSAVTPSAAVRPATLTTAPAAPAALAVQKSAAGGPSAAAARTAPARAATGRGSLFRPPQSETPAFSPVEFGAPLPPAAQPVRATQPTAQRLTLGQSRRLGLGLPLGTISGSGQPSPDSEAAPLPLAQPSAQRSAAASATAPAGSVTAGSTSGAPTSSVATPAGPSSPVSGGGASTPSSATPPTAGPDSSATSGGSTGQLPAGRAAPAGGHEQAGVAAAGSGEAAPIIGSQPLVQRVPSAGTSVGQPTRPARASRHGLGEPLHLAGRPTGHDVSADTPASDPRVGLTLPTSPTDAAAAALATPGAGSPAGRGPVQRAVEPGPQAGRPTGGGAIAGERAAQLPDAPLLGAPLATTSIEPGAILASPDQATVHGDADVPLRIQRRRISDGPTESAPLQLGQAAAQPPPTSIADDTPLSLALPSQHAPAGAVAAATATTLGAPQFPGAVTTTGSSGTVNAQRLAAAAAGGPAATVGRSAKVNVSGLIGSRPLLAGAVQRATVPAPNRPVARTSAASAVQRSVAGSPAPVRVFRDEAAGQAAGSIGARAFTQGNDIFLPAEHGPLDATPARGLFAHELVHVQQQRTLGAQLPREDSPAGRVLELQARRAQSAANDGATSGPAGATLPLASSRTAVRAAATEAVAAAVAQRAVEVAPAPIPSPVPLAPIQREVSVGDVESTVAGSVPSASIPSDPRQLDELAGRLWPRLRGRLRRELLADRERAGMLTDLR